VRHVKGIQFDNIEIKTDKEDQRPAFVLDQVEDADFFRIHTPRVSGVPAFSLRKVSDFNLHFCSAAPDTHVDQTDLQNIG